MALAFPNVLILLKIRNRLVGKICARQTEICFQYTLLVVEPVTRLSFGANSTHGLGWKKDKRRRKWKKKSIFAAEVAGED
jgi:hypothetical protein